MKHETIHQDLWNLPNLRWCDHHRSTSPSLWADRSRVKFYCLPSGPRYLPRSFWNPVRIQWHCPWERCVPEGGRGESQYVRKRMWENMWRGCWYRLLCFCWLDHLLDTQGCAAPTTIPRCLAGVHRSHGLRRPADEKCSSPRWTQPAQRHTQTTCHHHNDLNQ